MIRASIRVAALTKAMAMAREHRFLLFLRHANSLTQELCAAALRAEIETEFVCDVIRRRRAVTTVNGHQQLAPWPVRLYTLGRFEIVARDGEWSPRAGSKRACNCCKPSSRSLAVKMCPSTLVSKIWSGRPARSQQVFDNTPTARKQPGSDTSILLADRALTLNHAEVWLMPSAPRCTPLTCLNAMPTAK
ncbi:MAG: hypothetical protein IPP88_04125 [Betaproteobacteria bacterium]|nr:hypothetical protein [Betaproteobacteria bacterium]